jgi:hypothetical protein
MAAWKNDSWNQHTCLVCTLVYFQTKNPNLGKFWKVLHGIFNGHFVYFTAKWNTLWPFTYIVHLVLGIFFPFWYLVPRKVWQPWIVERLRPRFIFTYKSLCYVLATRWRTNAEWLIFLLAVYVKADDRFVLIAMSNLRGQFLSRSCK